MAQFSKIDASKNSVVPTTPSELREAGNEAIGKGDYTSACHLYTLGIDIATRDIKRDKDGFANPGDLYECNIKTKGELSKLLANRSLSHLKLEDYQASLEDGEASIQAEPTFEKGHLRILAAMEKIGKISNEDKLLVVQRGILACPNGETLKMKVGRLESLVLAEKQNNTKKTSTSALPVSILSATMKAAQDPQDSRHIIACSDLGTAYACGAYGLTKNVEQAEKYLIIGSKGGDVAAQRNLGLLYLELNKPEQGAEQLKLASDQGDESATSKLTELAEASDKVATEALEKLKVLASQGDQRAIEMMKEFEKPR